MDTRLGAGHGATSDSGAYTDLNRLNQLKVGKERDSEGNIRKVAQEFESLFLNEMMKAMRSANNVFAEGNFMNSNESKTYQDMYDQQLAVTLSKEQGLGLADVLTRQLSKLDPSGSRPNPFAPALEAVSAPQRAPGAKSLAAVDSGRDDSGLINQRRLALPGRLSDRMLAGIAPPAAAATGDTLDSAAAPALSGVDWIPAKAYSVPKSHPSSQPLNLADSDAISGRRLAQPTSAAASAAAPATTAFGSKDDFIATLLPMAQAAADKIGVDPRYLVAQAALETGWGKSVIRQQDGSSSHNLFGIKTHDWEGESTRVQTTEYVGGKQVKQAASFRAYDSFEQSFDDYVTFLQGNGRYQKALGATDNPQRFVKELQQAGYATDPQYARKVAQIARQMQTYQTVASVDSPRTRT
ncbi:MAG: flagellar assembly peptidoglycan hydrolase FlgJ [Pseudomonas sp.]|uniref:flagellar assembly peptidoglycan hydrolase FlgJ n=1 Tax=Pseudomonas sp. TaxID=306 RepID=UPI0033949984